MSGNLTNAYGCTPLHLSPELGHLKATKFLVERGAAINDTNKLCISQLMLANCCAELEIFHYLADKIVHTNICDDCNNTALHLAAGRRSVNIIN